MGYKKVIYVAGRYGGDEFNKDFIETCCRQFTDDYPNYLFINGVSEFSHCYHSTSVLQGIEMCLELMKIADEVWVVGDDWCKSCGTMAEISVAKERGLPVKFGMELDEGRDEYE